MPAYADTEQYLKWCRDNGIKVKGHPLVWNHEDPTWLPEDLDEISALQMDRITKCVQRFKGSIDIWDVVNEPTDMERLKDKRMTEVWLHAGKVPFVFGAFKRARRANPGAILLINDYKTGKDYEEMIEKLVDEDGNRIYDAIGIQSHMHSGAWSVDKIWNVCERFSDFGVPLHFTEVTILSGKLGWNQPKPWNSTPDGEKYQAENAEILYKVLFSHPAVEAITWWDFSDRGTWMGAPAGLIRKDGASKPGYEKLHHLIREEWWTATSGKTDDEGLFGFRAFRGTYTVKVTWQDEVVTGSITVSKNGENRFTIDVSPADKKSPPHRSEP
jgi:GH35 family endo-1,4-beta-xylanase